MTLSAPQLPLAWPVIAPSSLHQTGLPQAGLGQLCTQLIAWHPGLILGQCPFHQVTPAGLRAPPQAQTMPIPMEEGPTQAPSRPAEAPCIAALGCSLQSGGWACSLCPPGGVNTETPPGNAPHRGRTLLALHWAWPGAGCREHQLLPSLQAPHQAASMVYSEMAGKGACPGQPALGHRRALC